MKEIDISVLLRNKVAKQVDDSDDTWYGIGKDAGLQPIESIYYLRKGGGLNGQNTIKLMKHLNIRLEEV